MNDAEKALAILGVLDTHVIKARSEYTEWLCKRASEVGYKAGESAMGVYDKESAVAYRAIHTRMTDAEDLFYFAMRCFIERGLK